MLKRVMDPRRKEMRATLVLVTLLMVVGSVSPSALRYHPHGDTLLRKIGRTLKKRGLNREATAKQTAGYYEGLLDQAAEVTRITGRSWLDWRYWLQDRRRRIKLAPQVRRSRPDFLRYDLPPNADVPEIDEQRRLVTSSIGLADREYDQTPSVGAWRIALVGDSVARGVGARFGVGFEPLLERALNDSYAGLRFDRYEIVNFSVQGYQLTQLVDVALHRVPLFAPHAYVVTLTERSVFTVWADHLASLVRGQIDLKYDYLRQIVHEAGVTPNQSNAIINARLAPYRVPLIRWALNEMNAHALRAGAPLVIVLVPTPDEAEMQIEQFRPVKVILDELRIPTIDLLETYVDFEDLAPLRVSAADRHPNERGHELLFRALWGRIDAEPSLRAVFSGIPADSEVWGQKSAY